MSAEQTASVPTSGANPPSGLCIDDAIEQGKRAFALSDFEQAVEHYASALELMTQKYGDASPECADIYFAYGKALLENAITQNSVLGKRETSTALYGDNDDSKASGSGGQTSAARIHFGEDTVEGDEDALETHGGEGEEQTVDLFAEATKEKPEGQDDGELAENDDEEDDVEPEDDFNAAWEVLEVARSLYEAQKHADDEVRLKLADIYVALGDVSLETEKLDQAATDYTAAVTLKSELLPQSSRQIAEAHYKLCIVYDMTPGRLAHAIDHARKAEASVQSRLDEITTRLQTTSIQDQQAKPDPKGKGKATATKSVSDTRVEDLTEAQLQSEIKDLQGLLEEVSLKIEELKSSPNLTEGPTPDVVARELDRDLNRNAASRPIPAQVNDLTSMVVKKKKATPQTAGEKRKAEDVLGSPEKKAKAEADEIVS